MKNGLYIALLLFTISLTAQRRELKRWTFYTEKDTVQKEVLLPHTWNTQDAFDDEPGYFRGKGFYSKEISIDNLSSDYFLHFNGANQITKVWVNGEFAGDHYGGYTAFDIEITPFLEVGNNTLNVELDNSHNETIPPLDADFTFYGGIYRQVFLVEENTIHFNKEHGADVLKIDAKLDTNGDGIIEITGTVFNDKLKKCKVKISIPQLNKNLKIRRVSRDFNETITLDSPKLWSPATPHLYEVIIELFYKNKLVDSYVQKIGFRKFEAGADGFKLNGKPVKLIGVNRHQDLQGFGNAVPIQKQLQDLVMIKEMGANFLRLAHYPQDKEVYKAADSLGLLLWSEIPVVNKVPASSDFEEYKFNSLEMQKEHIAQNYNHPSLVFIGYMNEIFLRMVFDKPETQTREKTIKNTLELARSLEGLTRQEAPHHITVMALHGNQIYNESGIADLPMVIGWNLYYGWYGGRIRDLGGFLDEEFAKYPQRPLIISEYGVGADIRLHNDTPVRFDFSEEYQFKFHPSYYEQVMERDYVIGMSAWNYADFGSEFRGDAQPHINQKGLVNFDRSPKNIYHWYKAELRPEVPTSRFFKGLDSYSSDSSQKEILIISNKEVTLKDNFGYRTNLTPMNSIIHYYSNLFEGSNTFGLYTKDGKYVDSLKINYTLPTLKKVHEVAVNFTENTYFKDSKGQLWTPINKTSLIQISGNAKYVKTSTNIKSTIDDPLYQTIITNVDSMYIDVPKGSYELTLLLSRHGKETDLVYELSGKENVSANKMVTNAIKINNIEFQLPTLLPFTQEEIKGVVMTTSGIHIVPMKGKLSMAGILITKIK